MDPLSEIREKIKRIAKGNGSFTCFTAKVVSVDGETCDVELDGMKLTSVRLRAVVNGENSKILVTPKSNSYVLVADLAGDLSQLAVVVYSEVEKIEIDAEDKIIFNGGNNHGLVKVEELKRNLDSLKNYVETMKTAIEAGFTSVGVGTSASGPSGKTAFVSGMATQSINFEDMEDTNITH